MRSSLIVYDDFLNNPLQCRQEALKLTYGEYGNYPGIRAKVSEQYLGLLLPRFEAMLGKISDFKSYFQYTTASARSWIHADHEDWAAVLYLSPDAPISSGTGFFKHSSGFSSIKDDKIDASIKAEIDVDSQDFTKWDKTLEVGNIFNRLILYPGDLFHTSLDYFGRSINDGRLFQVFFINMDT